jgi:hypothetical protein
MINNMNFNSQETSYEYKECAGKGCEKVGIHCLKIVFLNKIGWFCDDCKNDLLFEKLVDESQQSDPTTTSQSLAKPGKSVTVMESTKRGTLDGA